MFNMYININIIKDNDLFSQMRTYLLINNIIIYLYLFNMMINSKLRELIKTALGPPS